MPYAAVHAKFQKSPPRGGRTASEKNAPELCVFDQPTTASLQACSTYPQGIRIAVSHASHITNTGQ